MYEEERTGVLNAPAEAPPTPRNPLDAVNAVARPKQANAGEEPDGAAMLSAEHAPAPGAEGGDYGDYGEFDWPEGYVADSAALARFVPLARRLGLPKESAQSLAGLYAELDRERQSEQARFIAQNNDRWLGEIRDHPEFGGRNLARTGENVAAMIRRFGTPLLTAQIRQMNVQNWPEMFYFLARVSQAVSEDCSPSSSSSAAPAQSTAQLLFPGLK